jgi:hypothetical protein
MDCQISLLLKAVDGETHKRTMDMYVKGLPDTYQLVTKLSIIHARLQQNDSQSRPLYP